MSNTAFNGNVNDRQSFIHFVAELRKDLREHPETWTNIQLDEFLEAVERYSEDIQGYYDNTKQKVDANVPTWKVFADIFKGASVYE